MRICDRCGKNPAVIHLTRISHNGRSEVNLCMQCVTGVVKLTQQKAMAQSALDQTIARHPEEPGAEPRKCEGCGFTVEEIRKTGRMGCARCYRTFSDLIEPVLGALGKAAVPSFEEKPPGKPAVQTGSEAEIRGLRDQMKRAVDREEYEEAARIRDRIKVLEAGRSGA